MSINKSIGANLEVQMVKRRPSYVTPADGMCHWFDLEMDHWRDSGGRFWCEKRWYYGMLGSKTTTKKSCRKTEQAAHQTLLIPAGIIQLCVWERAISVPRFLAFNSSPWQQEKPWLHQLARRQGEGTSPQTLTSDFTFLQPRPRLAQTLPRAIRYFLMNYISELKMKALGGSQKHIAVGQQGNQIAFKCA